MAQRLHDKFLKAGRLHSYLGRAPSVVGRKDVVANLVGQPQLCIPLPNYKLRANPRKYRLSSHCRCCSHRSRRIVCRINTLPCAHVSSGFVFALFENTRLTVVTLAHVLAVEVMKKSKPLVLLTLLSDIVERELLSPQPPPLARLQLVALRTGLVLNHHRVAPGDPGRVLANAPDP